MKFSSKAKLHLALLVLMLDETSGIRISSCCRLLRAAEREANILWRVLYGISCALHKRLCRSKHALSHKIIWVKGSEKITFAPILYVDRVVCVNFTVFTVIFR